MFPDLALATTPGRHIAPDTVANSLVASLLSLLDLAGAEMEGDVTKAKLTIRRASSMLRVDLERRADHTARHAKLGELTAWQLNRVRSYIDEHLSERIYVKDLSAVARRSTAHFCRAFKCTMGETPHSFITRRRLDRAQSMMLTSDAPLAEIALQCGFADQAHFCNRFRCATGQSPAAWRRERLGVNRVNRVGSRSAAMIWLSQSAPAEIME